MGSHSIDECLGLNDPALIEKLTSSLQGSKVLTPSSDGYADAIKRWSEASEKKAGAVVLATSAADISSAVLFAKDWSLDLAVRGGGHSTSGASSSDGGLVIDLSAMRKVTVDPSKMTITAQGGCLWEDVDNAAAEYGLATVGGTVNHTGIGGLTLGGGYGWLSGKYGLVIDNLISVQMVLADGSIVTASKTENTDLFWAVCGAGQSFGVASEFTYQAHEQKSSVWAGQLAFPPLLEELAAVANQLLDSSDGNSGIILGFATPPPLFKPMVLAVVYFNGPESSAKEFFAPLFALGPIMDTTGSMPYAALNSILNDAATHGDRKSSKGATFTTPLQPAFFHSLFAEYSAFSARIPGASAIMLFEFFPTRAICRPDPIAIAFANRGHHQNVLVSPKWTDPADDAACRAWAGAIAQKFDRERERAAREGEHGHALEGVGQYGNYDGLEEAGSVIFGANYGRLVELKRRFDPGNLFSKSHL